MSAFWVLNQVEVTHAAAKYLVDQARKNTHSPVSSSFLFLRAKSSPELI